MAATRVKTKGLMVLPSLPPFVPTVSLLQDGVSTPPAALRDLPGVARVQQLLEVALAARADGGPDLLRHLLVVDRAVDVAEDADRDGADRRPGQPRQRERKARLGVVRVVDDEAALGRVSDLGRSIGPLTHALRRFLGAERDRLPVLEIDPVRLDLAHEVEGSVVVDVAVLEDLDERRAAVL